MGNCQGVRRLPTAVAEAVAAVIAGPRRLWGASGSSQLPNCVIPVQEPLESSACRNVPSTGPSEEENVIGTVTVILLPDTFATMLATFTLQWLFASVCAPGPIGTPDMGPSQPVPALSINRTPLLYLLYSTRHDPVAV